MKRLLYVTSKRKSWADSQDNEVHFKNAPYSIDAIGYNLTKLGWVVGWAGWTTSRNPFALARKMAESGVYEGSGRAKNHVFGLDEFLVRYPDVAVDLADGRGKQTGEHAGTFRYVDATPSGLMLIVR